jgi:hypothetical protein
VIGAGSGLVGGVLADVGPLGGKGAVEALDAPILSSARVGQVGVDFSGDVTLQAADDLAFAKSFSGASFDVRAGGFMPAHSDDGDDVERTVRCAVAAAGEPVPAGGPSAARRLWRDSTEFRERSLVADPVGVIANGDEELPCNFSALAVELDEVGGALVTRASI